ncbi:MAG: aldehyde dehydrogenase (NADP(+)) [Terriglobia bacterium]
MVDRAAQQLHGKNQLGAALSAQGSKSFRGFNPKTSEWLEPVFSQATGGEVDAALALAREATPVLRRARPETIATLLETAAEEMLALGDSLLERAAQETGLDLQRLTGERARTTTQMRLFADVVKEGSWVDARIDTALPDRKPLPRPDLRRILTPVGPVAVFGASNFPLAFSVAGGDTVSALAARNPVVVKAHPAHPGTSELAAQAIARAVERCRFPEGTFSMVHATDPEISLALVRHPAVKAVAFTGSLAAGRAIFDAAAQRPDPIPAFVEMGSINPVFVLPGALQKSSDDIAHGLLNSINLGAGQFCTCPGVIAGRSDAAFQQFAENLAALFSQAPRATMLHPGILRGYDDGIRRALGVAGVRAHHSSSPPSPALTSAAPVLLEADANTWLSNPALSEEIFGPASIVIHAERDEDLLEVAQRLPGSLTATVFGDAGDLEHYSELIAILETKAGRLIFNGYPTGVEVTYAMHHGGPYPATADPKFTSVGTAAILRFARPVCYQNFPDAHLPPELANENTRGIWRTINGQLTKNNL